MSSDPIASADAYVLDVGSLNTYWGYAGDEEPRQCITSAWCHHDKDWSKLPAEFLQLREHYVPQWTSVFAGLPEPLRSYAQQDQIVPAKGDMVDAPVSKPSAKQHVNPKLSKANYFRTLEYINEFYGDCERLKGRPMLVSQPTKSAPDHTRCLAEVAFERMDVGAFYAMRKAGLAAMGMGRPTACVVELGPVGTNVTPVFEGYNLQRNMQQYAVGGLLQDWMLATTTKLWDSNAFTFHPFSELRQKRFGAFPVQTEKVDPRPSAVHPAYLHCAQRRIVQDLKENVLRVNMYKPPHDRAPDDAEDIAYELPDGKVVYVSDQTARDVSEFLLTPAESATALQCLQPFSENLTPLINGFPGLATAVIASAFNCHVEIRNTLLQNVVVVGGPAAADGLIERIAADLSARPHVDVALRESIFGAPADGKSNVRDVSTIKFKVASQVPMERKFTTWVGGSVMAMLSSFRDVWISREDWAESGPTILERRRMFA